MDLFLGADFVYPEKIVAAGLADGTAPTQYARGTLVLWARKDSPLQPISLDTLMDKRVTSVAIANDLHAPYGQAAVAALKRMKMYDTGETAPGGRREHRAGGSVCRVGECAAGADLADSGEFAALPGGGDLCARTNELVCTDRAMRSRDGEVDRCGLRRMRFWIGC